MAMHKAGRNDVLSPGASCNLGGYPKQADGCCHKTVIDRCPECPYHEKFEVVKTLKDYLKSKYPEDKSLD